MPGDENASRDAGRRAPPKAIAWLVTALWLIGSIVLVWHGITSGAVASGGDLDAMLPVEHRSPRGEPWVMLEAEDSEDPNPEESGARLQRAARVIGDELGDGRLAVAPPAADLGAWLDRHALYLLPPSKHGELEERLSDDLVAARIQELRAQLGSPFFGVSGQDARRDPLNLRELSADTNLPGVEAFGPAEATVTPAGDLLSKDRRRLLMQVRSEDLDQTRTTLTRALKDQPGVALRLLGPEARNAAAQKRLRQRGPRAFVLVAAGLVIALALGLRRVRPVLALVAALGTLLMGFALAFGGLDLLALPLGVLLGCFCCDAALRQPNISNRGWASVLIVAVAWLPLWLTDNPTWQTWSVAWVVGFAVGALGLRALLPSVCSALGGDLNWRRPGFSLAGMPGVAMAICALLCGGGAWAAQTLVVRGADAAQFVPAEHRVYERDMADAFFDPELLVEAHSRGGDPGLAFERAAADVAVLHELVPVDALALESPATLVLPEAEIQARRARLGGLGLRARMRHVQATLESQGLRADAFGEFLHAGAQIDEPPSAARALDGPLAKWVARFFDDRDDHVVLRSRLHLRAEPPGGSPAIAVENAGGERIDLFGPAIAARRARASFQDHLGLVVTAGLWLGAFVVWIATRSLPIALASGLTALACQSGALLSVRAIGSSVDPHAAPALLLVGAVATVAAGRAARAAQESRPIVARGILLGSVCQVVGGVGLLASGVAAWMQWGLIVATGSVLSGGLGLFVAPGIAAVFSGLRRTENTETSRKKEGSDGDQSEGDE